jgi:hypothetical protein
MPTVKCKMKKMKMISVINKKFLTKSAHASVTCTKTASNNNTLLVSNKSLNNKLSLN